MRSVPGRQRRNTGRVDKERLRIRPSVEAAFKVFGRSTYISQPSGGALAELDPSPADDDDRSADEFACPG